MSLILDGTNGVSDIDGSASTPAIRGTDTNTGIFFPAADTIAFAEGGAEVARFDSSGNLGIGTSSGLSARVTISGVDAGAALDLNSTGTLGRKMRLVSANGAYGGLAFEDVTANALRMLIDSSGNLLVGTTSGTGFCRMNLSTDSGTNKWDVGPRVSIPTNFYVLQNQANGVYIASGGNSWTAFSDERLKTDLKPIENAVEKVITLRSVTGRYKTDAEGISRSFLIAQDVQKILPEAVDVSDPERFGVSYTDVIPLLVAAIKELNAKVDAQAVEIATLKAK